MVSKHTTQLIESHCHLLPQMALLAFLASKMLDLHVCWLPQSLHFRFTAFEGNRGTVSISGNAGRDRFLPIPIHPQPARLSPPIVGWCPLFQRKTCSAVTGCVKLVSSFLLNLSSLLLGQRFIRWQSLSSALIHPAGRRFLNAFSRCRWGYGTTVGSQSNLSQGLLIYWTSLAAERVLSDRSSTLAFLPSLCSLLPRKSRAKGEGKLWFQFPTCPPDVL